MKSICEVGAPIKVALGFATLTWQMRSKCPLELASEMAARASLGTARTLEIACSSKPGAAEALKWRCKPRKASRARALEPGSCSILALVPASALHECSIHGFEALEGDRPNLAVRACLGSGQLGELGAGPFCCSCLSRLRSTGQIGCKSSSPSVPA